MCEDQGETWYVCCYPSRSDLEVTDSWYSKCVMNMVLNGHLELALYFSIKPKCLYLI